MACATVVVLLLCSVSPLRSVARFRISRGLHRGPVHLFHSTSVLTRLRRTSGLQGVRRTRSGYWHTEGSRILSDRGTPVRIGGLNWSGFETPAAIPGGLRFQDYHAILRLVASSGYNTLRLPYSNQMVEQPTVPTNIEFQNEQGRINADLEGLDSMQILDHIVAAAGELGLKVILDDHRSEAGSSAEESGLWYTEQYPEQAWISDWATLAHRYRDNPTVIGFDLRNEPHNVGTAGACWSCGGERDWHHAAERAGNAVLAENPNLLIFVEGVDQYEDTNSFWGGDLAGVRKAPVRLALAGRLVYSPHVYGPSEYSQPWFNGQTTPASLMAKYRKNWAYINESGMAPVWIGEFGAPNDAAAVSSTEPGSEGQWFHTLVDYMEQHPEVGWTYWSLNGEDRYGLLDGEYHTGAASPQKALQLARIQMPQPVVRDAPPQPGTQVARNTMASRMSRFHFHLPSGKPSKNTAAEIQVVYDEPHGTGSPAAGGPAVVRETAAARSGARPRDATSRADYTGAGESPSAVGVSPAGNSTVVSGAMAEQIRRETESALEHLPPVKR